MLTALSEETYHQLLEDNADGDNSTEEDKSYFRWGYAESPYLGFGYEEHFAEVNKYYSQDVSYDLDDDEFEEHVNDWLQAMTDVMKTLKEKGLFMNADGEGIFLLAEQQPSDTDYNIVNARKLNDETLYEIWYRDNKAMYE